MFVKVCAEALFYILLERSQMTLSLSPSGLPGTDDSTYSGMLTRTCANLQKLKPPITIGPLAHVIAPGIATGLIMKIH